MEGKCLDAFSAGDKEESLRLLKVIKDPRQVKNKDGFTLLHLAAQNGWTDIVELLVTKYNYDVNSGDYYNRTPVSIASSLGHLDIVKCLYNTGKCDLFMKSRFGDTPLDVARSFGHHEIVEYLTNVMTTSTLTLAMKEGGGKMKTCNTILHGPPGVGKSSLKRLILGQPPLPKEKQNATNIVETAARALSTDRYTAKGRKLLAEVDNTEMIKMLAKKAESLRLNSHKSQHHDITHHHIPESQHIVESVSDSPLNTSNSETLKSIREQLAEQVEPSSEIFDVDWMYLTDSGGQPQFLDVLPLLYRNESLQIVVTRLDEGLDDKPKVRFYNKGEDVYTFPDCLTLTNREFIERACQIAEAQAMSGKFVPKVMVVGTHKDNLGIDGEARLKKINEELRKIHQKYNRILICKSEDEVIFDVNAMSPVGKERQQYTEELQDCILKAVEKTGEVIDVPLKWLAFHLDLDKKGGIVRKSECYKTGEILGMGRSDVDEALKYFDKVGLLLHYPDDVPDLVFTKMDSLISRLSRLIIATFIIPGSSVTAPYDRLRERGLFNKSFLPTIFKDLYESREEFSDDDFLKILESLKISVHVRDDDYFLPSALSLNPPVDDSSFPMSCVPLVYSWDEQILPHSFFPTFVVELLRQQSRDNLYFELRIHVIQCRDVIQVVAARRNIPGFLKLVDRKRWIEICYSCSTTKYCSMIREITSYAVERVIKRFEHTGIKSPKLGFRCRLCDIDDHYCVLSKDLSLVQCYRNEGPVTPDMSCWIDSTDQSTATNILVDDKPLTRMSDLVPVLRAAVEVTDWHTLGLALGLPVRVLDTIRRDGYDETDRKQKMIFKCLDTGVASWSSLVKALKSPLINKARVAEQICKDHPQTYSGVLTYSGADVNKTTGKIRNLCLEMPNAQGIIFVIGLFGRAGTDVDIERMSSIFHDDLNFAVYREKVLTCADLACLVKAAAEYDEYPKSYRFIAFYYAGHGGIDSVSEYLLPMHLRRGDVLYIDDHILSPFTFGNRGDRKVLCFIDCCVSTTGDQKKEFNLMAPRNGLVAYVTSKLRGDKIYGGLWTRYLCNHLTRAESLSTILDDASDEFMKHIGEDEYMVHKPHYDTSIIGEIYLKESGHMYVKAFKDAVEKEGSISMHMVQLMPFGPPRVGKTCLLNRLLNRHAPGIRATRDSPGSGSDSTIVLDNRKMIHSTFVADGGDWKEIKNLDEESAFYIKSSTESQPVPKDSSDSVNESATPTVSVNRPITPSHAPVKELNSQISIAVHSPSQPQSVTKFNDEPRLKAGNVPVKPGPDSDTSVTHTGSNLLNEVLNSMKNKDMTKVQKLLDDTLTIFYTDTGGQPEFQEVLPALVAGPTIFLLIFSLAKGLACLGTTYTVTYRAPDGESVPYESSFTVKEVFLQCLSSIASYHNALSRDVALLDSNTLVKTRVPPLSVLAVATHKDLLVDEEEMRKIDEELRAAVEQTSLHKSECVEYCPDEDEQLIIPVDNYNEGNDSNAVKKAVQIIIRRKQGKESPYKIEFPVPWLALELYLRHLPQSIITYEECIDIAKQCNVSSKDLPKCLWFLHHKTGTIRYYHGIKALEDYIIVKPDVIFKAVSKLITNTFTRKEALNPEVMDFKRLGLFKRDTLEQIFKNQSELQINCDVFLALLEHLNILGPSHDPELGDYFLPCALVHADPSSSEIPLDPLLVVFKGGFVPKGVFSALLVYLLREMKWRIQCYKGRPCLYRNQVSFYTNGNVSVTLKATPNCFEVCVKGKQPRGTMDSWYNIRKVLENGIFNVCQSLRYDQSFCAQKFGFYCNLPECEGDVSHIAEVVDGKYGKIECFRSGERYDMNKERKDWFTTNKPDCPNFSGDDVKKAKRKIRKTCQNKPDAQGIIFVADMLFVGAFGNPGGTDVDADNIRKTFCDDLNFATYRIKDPSCPKLACLVRAAAEFDKYPLNYDFIAFYYAGHGGIDESCREFVLPDGDTKNVLYIKDDIISPLTSAAKLGRKYIFFFDCCLNYSPGIVVHGTEKVFNLESPQDCLVAYATSINQKAGGNVTYGGLWTHHLCQRLKTRDLLSAILDHTVEDVKDDQARNAEKDKVTYQLPHYTTNAGEVYLKEEGKQICEEVETVSQNSTNKRPTITLQHSISRGSEKSSNSDSDEEDKPVAKRLKNSNTNSDAEDKPVTKRLKSSNSDSDEEDKPVTKRLKSSSDDKDEPVAKKPKTKSKETKSKETKPQVEEELKLTPKAVETVSQSPTNKRHCQPTNTLQRTLSRGSEKSSSSDDEAKPVAKKTKTKSGEESKHKVQVKDYLDDVHVAGESHFHIKGDKTHSFNWEECGLRIHVEQGTIPSSSTCQVAIKALVGGEFLFPSNTELVSAVYAISVSETLLKPIKLSVQHCVVLKHNQQAEYLSFAKSPLTPPHKFEMIEGGQFPTNDRYGFIMSDSFSLLAILKRIKRWILRQESPSMNEESTEHVASQDSREGSDITGMQATITIDQSTTSTTIFEEYSLHVDHESNTESLVQQQTQTDPPDTSPTSTVSLSHDVNESTSTPQYSESSHLTQEMKDNPDRVPDNQYYGQVYYVPKIHVPNSWLMKFLVGKDLETLKTYMTNEHSHAEEDIFFLFCFHSDDIELNLSEEQERPNKGWEVFPLQRPCKLSKKEADKFGSKRNPFPPQCLVKVCGENEPDTAKFLRYYVPLIGVECQYEEICISRDLDTREFNTTTADPRNIQESVAAPPRKIYSTDTRAAMISPDVFRSNHAELCKLLNTSEPTLLSLTIELYSKSIIDTKIKIDVLKEGGLAGADILLTHVQMKIEQSPAEHLDTVQEAMENEQFLDEIVKKMKKESMNE